MGIAIIKDTELVEWRMKVFNDNWSQVKLEKILSTLQGIIEKNDVTVIALKVLHSTRSSEGLNQLISAITALTKSKQIALYSCSITDIKAHCSLLKRCNKGVIVEYVLDKHPELHREYQREQGNLNPYYIKTFEAIAVARLYVENMK